jgi:hypothetical protein
MNTGHHHSDAVKATVRELWTEKNLSQREIARRIGISKNSLPGLIRRMGLPKREQDARRAPRGWVARKIEIAKPKAPAPIGPIGDFPAGATCRHIAGEPHGAFQCCGHPGFPYCEFHTARNRIARVAS